MRLISIENLKTVFGVNRTIEASTENLLNKLCRTEIQEEESN